jgi:hypothetical protein
MIYPTFQLAIDKVEHSILELSYPLKNERWQSLDIAAQPGHEMREVFNTSFEVAINNEDYHEYHTDIEPNLPWADDHFEERVWGVPLNPGVQWANWPYANSADKFRTEGKQFSHTYMERYWPQLANIVHTASGDVNPLKLVKKGIRYRYGDLLDVANHLHDHPETRQAYLPVWFPEDTGVVHGERVPCTLGYHFMMRHGYLHMTYYIRSCDYTRHFRDDLYLSLRLQLWMLDKLRSIEEGAHPRQKKSTLLWPKVHPGIFVFHCASMHIFQGDFEQL